MSRSLKQPDPEFRKVVGDMVATLEASGIAVSESMTVRQVATMCAILVEDSGRSAEDRLQSIQRQRTAEKDYQSRRAARKAAAAPAAHAPSGARMVFGKWRKVAARAGAWLHKGAKAVARGAQKLVHRESVRATEMRAILEA